MQIPDARSQEYRNLPEHKIKSPVKLRDSILSISPTLRNLIPVSNRHHGANDHHKATNPQHIDLREYFGGEYEHIALR